MNNQFEKNNQPPANEAEKTEEEAGYEVIHDYAVEAELLLFYNIIEAEKKDKNIPKEETKKLEEDFDEYMKLRHELISKHKGDFTQKMVSEKIPNNRWVKIMKEIFSSAREKSGSSDIAEEAPKKDRFTLEDKAKFKKDVAKKMTGQDFH